MNRLLQNDFGRLIRSKTLPLAVAAAVVGGLAAVPLCPGYQAVMTYAQAYLFLIPVISIVTIVFVTQEYRFGIVRNKAASGFSRVRILCSWAIVMAAVSVLLLLVFTLTVRIRLSATAPAVQENLTAETFFVNSGMALVLMLVFVGISLAVGIIGAGYEDIVIVLLLFFGAAEAGTRAAGRGGLLRRLLAVVPTTHLGDSVVEVPETAGATFFGGVILIVLFSLLALVAFRRKNLE
ncbi:MAG: hypothetical protein K6B39_10115 [Lachnospiraceae bacterium]|nr:hypothetical protein [Lachnospiraceae bacterium]